MPNTRTLLNAAGLVTLDANGNGTAHIGPDAQRGPANWEVNGVILTNGRPGQAPIPRVQVYLDAESAANRLGVSYDGSFAQGKCDINISRGQTLIAVWSDGKAGDNCELSVTGWKW